jgi:hypothetical protein
MVKGIMVFPAGSDAKYPPKVHPAKDILHAKTNKAAPLNNFFVIFSSVIFLKLPLFTLIIFIQFSPPSSMLRFFKMTCPPRNRPSKMLVYLQSKGDKGHEKETALGGRDNPDPPGSRRWADGDPSMSKP